MPIASTDILFKLSVLTGAAGKTTAGTAAGSLGKYMSTTEVPDATLHALFDQISGAENEALEAEYRCIFVHNDHATLTLQSTVVWLLSETADGADIEISVDTTAASDGDSATAQAKEVADEDTAPSAQSFSAPTTKGAGLSIGDLAPDECRAIWIKRTTTDSAAQLDGVVLRVEGDTDA